MPDIDSIRFIHRVLPQSTLIQRAVFVLIAIGFAIWLWPLWQLTVLLALFAAGFFIWFSRTRIQTFIVTAEGLTIIKRPLIGLGGSFDFFSAADVRRIRYRSEKHLDPSREYAEMHYILDMVTADSRTVVLLKEIIVSFDPKLGKKLARALDVSYEEYLEPE